MLGIQIQAPLKLPGHVSYCKRQEVIAPNLRNGMPLPESRIRICFNTSTELATELESIKGEMYGVITANNYSIYLQTNYKN